MSSRHLKALLRGDSAPRTYAQLSALASRSTVARAVAAGDLVRVLPDQYCLAEHAESWTMRARAAAAWAGPGAAVGGLAALAVFGYTPLPIDTVDLVVPWGPGRREAPEWLRVRHLTVPFRTAVWSPRTPVLIPAVAVALGYGSLRPSQRASFVHGAVKAGLVDPSSLSRALNDLPRVASRADLVKRIGHIENGAESYLEERGMTGVFRGAAFMDLTFQHRLRVRGVGYRLDAVHLPTRTVFELDGGGHGKPEQRQKDVTRDALLATLGYVTVRFTLDDVTLRPDWCREVAREVVLLRANDA